MLTSYVLFLTCADYHVFPVRTFKEQPLRLLNNAYCIPDIRFLCISLSRSIQSQRVFLPIIQGNLYLCPHRPDEIYSKTKGQPHPDMISTLMFLCLSFRTATARSFGRHSAHINNLRTLHFGPAFFLAVYAEINSYRCKYRTHLCLTCDANAYRFDTIPYVISLFSIT